MEIITMILSGLALLAAILCLILILQEKKRNQKRNTALTDFIHTEIFVAEKSILAKINEWRKDIEVEQTKNLEHAKGIMDILQPLSTVLNSVACAVSDYRDRIENLEKGIVPDYEEALAAKDAVDNFNRGLSSILGFDPLEAAKKSRQERTIGGRVE